MSNINQDYYIMVRDFSLPHLIPFTMGSYGSSYRRILDKEYLNKPIEFKVNNEFWESGGRPSDVIYDGDGLIISDKLKEDFFIIFIKQID